MKKNLVFINKKSGDYNVSTNVIRVREKFYLLTIDNELLHMASSFYDKKIKFFILGLLMQQKKVRLEEE